jgi:hypothetical protein
MAEIRDVDLAWETLTVFLDILGRALAVVEQRGGEDPATRCPNDTNGDDRRRALQKRCERIVESLLVPINLTTLIAAYKQAAEKGVIKYKSRRDYAARMARIEREYGALPLMDVTSKDLEQWRTRWSTDGTHPAMGNAVLTVLRILLRFGAMELGDSECSRLALYRFPSPEKIKRGERKQINVAQLNAFRAQAHKMGLHTLALGTAIQFYLKLSQLELIGYWVPMSEPGSSNVTHNKKKWFGGLDWSQVDADFILRLPGGDEDTEIDLKDYRPVREELERLPEIPDSGPMVIYEPLGVPYLENEYHTRWRKVATAVGIPEDVFNTRRPKRERVVAPLTEKHAFEIATEITRPISDNEIRNEVRQEVSRDLVSGVVTRAELPKAKARYIATAYKKLRNRYDVSLDEVVAGRRLGDSISSDHNVWRG